MPLIQLWEKTPDIVLQYNIKQIVSAAGDGVLLDDSECSKELRYYLRNIPAEKLFQHIEYCLSNSFDKGGIVLQDIVNELGRRLDYEVEDGLYQGRSNKIGNDGVWRSSDGHAIILEIKTTDAYRINLDTVATYRSKLIDNGHITQKSSILIVVGRNDTGDLEAQIRGSRHAWDARIISMDALIKLVELKISSDEDQTVDKIRSLLVPFEYTRLDNIIDVMFTTAKDVESGAEDSEERSEKRAETTNVQIATPQNIIDMVKRRSFDALAKKENINLIASKRSHYWSNDRKIRAVCTVSKLYDTGYFWYSVHPHQIEFLKEAEKGYLLLGCVGKEFCYALPFPVVSGLLQYLNMTENTERHYWHMHLQPAENGEYQLLLPKKGINQKLDLSQYKLLLAGKEPAQDFAA